MTAVLLALESPLMYLVNLDKEIGALLIPELDRRAAMVLANLESARRPMNEYNFS
eukprot:CAMPEP_0185590038 /NCGR_PEP_ID=MMETSP0434-20130131/59215_1 /TAXON_ID=626734 ORGANISM="Favella taraikaensis, Strain Fe Narragansett Bay" /NCGR_SAMPLE_ID=MMETSP0434 /ASSEMBLY_ACC=CAM_ASM_000379 /LENGTH=54 /DNA_ID=CAMNT_0028213887 /DNA_START=332 /DNA_END=492 /DNA_ORIENTATION=-